MKTLFFLLPLILVYAAERPIYIGHFEPESTGVFLPVKIGGKECKFLFDTGASFVVLDRSLKPLLGAPLSLEEAQERTGQKFSSQKISTPNGEISLQMYKAVPSRLGRLQVANRFPFLLADLQALWPFSGVEFCGVLGNSFLHQFRWEIDFELGEIRAYIGVEPYHGRYDARLPLSWSQANIPQLRLDLLDREVLFDIDMGDNGSGRIEEEELNLLQENNKISASHMRDVVTVSDLSRNQEFRLKHLNIAATDYTGLVLQVSEQNALGMGFFRRHFTVLDFPFNQLYLKHRRGYRQRDEVDKSGIRIIRQADRFIVFSIRPVKGGMNENLAVGDEIISLNGDEDISLYTLRKAFKAASGTDFILKVKRKDASFPVHVILGDDPLR